MKDQPKISDARDICTRYRKRGAVILTIDGSTYHFASYGFSRSWCDGMRHVVEQMAGLIEAGVIEIPDNGRGKSLHFDPIAEENHVRDILPAPQQEPGGRSALP